MIIMKMRERKELCCSFLDFRAAFNTVNRYSLFYIQSCYEVSTMLIRGMDRPYGDTRQWGADLREKSRSRSVSALAFNRGAFKDGVSWVPNPPLSVNLSMYVDNAVMLADDPYFPRCSIGRLDK